MKRSFFVLALLLPPALVSCSEGAPDSSDGGAPGTGGAVGSGGTSSSGGAASGGAMASGGSTTTTGGSDGSGGSTDIDDDALEWRQANATNYTSYPDPGSEECVVYNGCTWAGYFAALDGKQSEEWVASNNIIAMFSAGDDNAAFDTYKLKKLRLRKNGQTIDVTVYDTCGDSDCDGCCTRNATRNGLSTLIDLESYTYERFGQGDGIIEWACLECE